MMMKEKSNPWARMKYLYVLPLAVIAVTAFARPEISNVTEEISKASADKVSELVTDRQAKVQEIGDTAKVDVVSTKFEVVEQMPEYPGGLGALMKFLGENLKYPAQAVKDSIQGRVVVTFVVDRDGSTRDFEVLRSVSPELDAEAVRVLALMPKWKPGMQKGTAVNVKYTIPVMFSLNKKKAPVTKGNTVSLRTAGGAKAANVLVVVNEKFYTTVEGLKRIKPEDIQSIDVLKDAKAIKAYGDVAKGKEGLIKVTLKPGAGMDANRGATEH